MSVAPAAGNADQRELAKFADLAHSWWDPQGPSRPLHELNPVRLAYVSERLGLEGARVCDVGCGGGLLSEAMAARGAAVVGIDLGEDVLGVARLHLFESGLEIDYRLLAAEDLAGQEPSAFDAVTCMEMLEHVPDPAAVVAACAQLLKPGGRMFLSTLNRTPKAFALAVVGAEYLLGLLPRGTHQYARFIRPAELGRWLRAAGLELEDVSGLRYDPLLRRASLSRDVSVNYLACARKPA
jgi:2-polyprenyl-6-hydroxyphenyl methylase / 3-demethylubiquinone-9 3-methyltransferase